MADITFPQVVDGGIDATANATNRTATFTSNILAGSQLLAVIATKDNSPSNIAVTDNKSNTWTRIGYGYSTLGGRGCAVFRATPNVASVGAKPIVTFGKVGSACTLSCAIMEAKDVHADFFDSLVVIDAAATVGPAQVTLASTTYTNDVIFAVLGAIDSGWASAAHLTGYTDLVANDSIGGSLQMKVITKATTASGVYTPGWTVSQITEWAVVAFALKGNTTLPTITGVDDEEPLDGSTITFTGVNFGASPGTLLLGGESQTINSVSDSSINITVDIGDNAYGEQLDVQYTTSTAVDSNIFTAITQVQPRAGRKYINLGTLHATAAKRLTAIPDLASTNQVDYESPSDLVDVFTNATFRAQEDVVGFYARGRTVDGWGADRLQRLISALAPSITSGSTASGSVGFAFAGYQITATNTPTSFGAIGLPSGMSVNTSTGYISGTPTSSGSFHVTISATNADGTGTQTLVITIAVEAPDITSTLTASGTTGVAFAGYHITASNSPTSYGATSLPPGLSINTSSGYITGTPTLNGTFNTTISATNITGTGSETLVFTIALAPATPVPERTASRPATSHLAHRSFTNRTIRRKE